MTYFDDIPSIPSFLHRYWSIFEMEYDFCTLRQVVLCFFWWYPPCVSKNTWSVSFLFVPPVSQNGVRIGVFKTQFWYTILVFDWGDAYRRLGIIYFQMELCFAYVYICFHTYFKCKSTGQTGNFFSYFKFDWSRFI